MVSDGILLLLKVTLQNGSFEGSCFEKGEAGGVSLELPTGEEVIPLESGGSSDRASHHN